MFCPNCSLSVLWPLTASFHKTTCVPAVVLWMSLEALGEELARSAHRPSVIPPSSKHGSPCRGGQSEPNYCGLPGWGPDFFQQEGIWLVKEKERTPVKRLTRVRILFRTSQLASEVYSPLPGPHSESRTVCGQRERPPQMAVSLSSVPSRYLALRCPSRGEQPHGGALSN